MEVSSKNSDGSRLDGTGLNDGSHNVEVITSDQAGTSTTQKQFTVDE